MRGLMPPMPTSFERDETLASHLGSVLRLPRVWLQAIIVVCAYVGYKGIDNYSLYAVQAWEMNEVDGAQAMIGQLYLAIFIGNLVGLRVSAMTAQPGRETG